jgi:hypothetical protein
VEESRIDLDLLREHETGVVRVHGRDEPRAVFSRHSSRCGRSAPSVESSPCLRPGDSPGRSAPQAAGVSPRPADHG